MRLPTAITMLALATLACDKRKADRPAAGPAPTTTAATTATAPTTAKAAPASAPSCDTYFAAVRRFLDCPAAKASERAVEAIGAGKASIEQALARLEALRASDPAAYTASLQISARSCEAAMSMLEQQAATLGCPDPAP